MIEENMIVLREQVYNGFETFLKNQEWCHFVLIGTHEVETDVFLEDEQRMESFNGYYFYIVENVFIASNTNDRRILVGVDLYTNESFSLEKLKEKVINEIITKYNYTLKEN